MNVTWSEGGTINSLLNIKEIVMIFKIGGNTMKLIVKGCGVSIASVTPNSNIHSYPVFLWLLYCFLLRTHFDM